LGVVIPATATAGMALAATWRGDVEEGAMRTGPQAEPAPVPAGSHRAQSITTPPNGSSLTKAPAELAQAGPVLSAAAPVPSADSAHTTALTVRSWPKKWPQNPLPAMMTTVLSAPGRRSGAISTGWYSIVRSNCSHSMNPRVPVASTPFTNRVKPPGAMT